MGKLPSISIELLNFELKELFESGLTTNTECWGVIKSKYRIGTTRFGKEYNVAKKEWAEAKKNLQIKVIAEKDTERLEMAIIGKNEGLQILSKIARGEIREVEGNIIVPSATDIRGAVLDIAKIQGWIVLKTANTDAEGNTAQNPLEKLIEAGGKIIING